jgi:hypothetical protein
MTRRTGGAGAPGLIGLGGRERCEREETGKRDDDGREDRAQLAVQLGSLFRYLRIDAGHVLSPSCGLKDCPSGPLRISWRFLRRNKLDIGGECWSSMNEVKSIQHFLVGRFFYAIDFVI